jgi:hypothetical protein
VTKIWYETKRILVTESSIDAQLPRATQSCLASEIAVSAELFSDPFNAYGSNVFWGNFEEVDFFFGGQKPFSKDKNVDDVLAVHGGSVSVLPPLDNMIASQYVERMLDILESADAKNTAVSFAVFLHAECFHDHVNGPSSNDLHLLDPRLGESNRAFVQRVEVLQASQHFFHFTGSDANIKVCPATSLFVLLQNAAGKSRYGTSDASFVRILGSMSVGVTPAQKDSPIAPSLGFGNEFPGREPAPLTPQANYLESFGRISPESQSTAISAQTMNEPSFGAIGGTSILQTFSPSSEVYSSRGPAPRRGRLFDLVDDGDEEHTVDVDVVSGMLNNLDVGLFQNGNSGPEVDIEAISLMGIGGPPSQTQPQTSRFRFS